MKKNKNSVLARVAQSVAVYFILYNCGYRYFHPSQGSKQSIGIHQQFVSIGYHHPSPQIQLHKCASQRPSTPHTSTLLQTKSIVNQPKFTIAICHPHMNVNVYRSKSLEATSFHPTTSTQAQSIAD